MSESGVNSFLSNSARTGNNLISISSCFGNLSRTSIIAVVIALALILITIFLDIVKNIVYIGNAFSNNYYSGGNSESPEYTG